MALVGADRSLERNETMVAALSCLRLPPMDNGMIRISGQLDPEAGAVPSTSKAQIVLAIDYDRLADPLRGAGTTLGGAVLAPETVRRLACDASIIPMVLGSMSQPLDVGRTKRLVTPALLAALWVRGRR